MVVVLSRFRVANGMEAEVARAFRERPRGVEGVPGFLWLEVFTDRLDPAVFYLETRWSDAASFEQWHSSPAHRDSHGLIPKGLKLDATWTKLDTLARIEGTMGPPVFQAVADAARLVGSFIASSRAIHLVVVDTAGAIRVCNAVAREQLAIGVEDGASLFDYMPEPDAAHLRRLILGWDEERLPVLLNFAAPSRVPFSLECWIQRHPDGATILGQPTFHRDQQLQNELMAINQELAALSRERSREVRDQRSGRELAEKLNRERNAFLTVLAHELRQPIGGALAAMGVLRRINPDPMLERPRAILERQLKQITRLVEDLSDTARVASGDVELRCVEMDLSRHAREWCAAWEAIAVEQHKTFKCRMPDAPLLLSADPERLQQVFSNLVTNAFKYTPPGGAVTFSVSADAGVVVAMVEDEGEGIPPERLPRIFDLFQRATSTGSGLGIGLAVVHALVQAHGGNVSASSPGLGQGATFTVRLPLLDT
jgi:signal transduction histidine kinase/heme-degrading monooxygenase HmoA